MDLKVSGHDVFLCLDKAYCVEDEATVLGPVSKYRPLLDWITRFRPSPDYTLSSITVRNVTWVAHRVASVSADITLQSTKQTDLKLVQAVMLTDLPAVAILPLFQTEGAKVALLVNNFRLPASGVGAEVFVGYESKPGSVALENEQALVALGFDLSAHSLLPLGSSDVTVGNEDLMPVKLFKTTKIVSAGELEQAQEAAKKLETATFSLSFVPLGDIANTTNDLKTVLSALLASQ